MEQTYGQPYHLSNILSRIYITPLGSLGLLILILLPYIPPFNQEYLIRWITMAAFVAASAIVFDLTAGYINIVNFGFNAFVGLGGYTSTILAIRFGLSPWIGIFVGALTAGILGFFTGLVTLRLRGIFAAVMCWFVGLALMGLATKLVFLTRGPLGLRAPRLMDTASNIPYYYLILIIMAICYFICQKMVRSEIGLAFKTIGQNMEAARTSGVNPVYYRILNFTVSCALAGWLGGFYAHYIGILTPDLMKTSKTIEILAIAYIGGRGSIWGGAVAAFPFFYGMENLRSAASNLPGIHLLIYGTVLMIVMIYYPGGLAELYRTIASKVKHPFWHYFLTNRRE